ncbi:MAG: recombinase family protein [Clostridia bacterium]|nr:recombinase family protein [Clostridia bacterium]
MYQYGYQAPKQRKVAVYARVSTEHEAQLSALENQKDWYKPIIAQHPEWDIVRMYTDEGITGTSAQKRPQFMKMIEDAGDGEFDLILTREVARFARNTVDTLQYTRSLKAKGVEVFFINDNIKTFDGDGELRLTIMATLAQDESRKTSIRVKCGQQTSMDNGVFYGNGNILGYDRVGKDMVINPEQAKTVRMIYDWYLDGVGIRAIKFRLEQAGRLTAMGKSNWHESNISKILQNSFYCGIITYHKEYTPDFLEQKKIRNFGEIELTKTRGTHEPIITEEEFERVQEMMAKRRKELPNTGAGKRRQIGEKQPGDVWTELLICECGHKFNRKVWHRVENDVQYGYQCYSSIRTGTVTTRLRKGLPIDDVCKTPMIAGWKLQMMVKNIFREYLHNTAEVLALAEAMLERHIDDEEPQTDNNRLIEQKHAEAEKLNKRLHSLIEMRADGEITRDIFKAKKQEIEDRLLAIQNELSQLQPQEEAIDDATHDEKIKILKFYLEQSVNPDAMDNIPEDVIRAFIVKVVVHENSFDWYLRFSPDKPPKSLCIDGKRKTTAKVSSLCSPHHRQQLKNLSN